MKSDSQIKRDVEDELKWEPEVDDTDIGVAVHNGVVTLSGFVHQYYQKSVAERAVKRVAGVVGVANDLEVRVPSVDQRPDPEIARDAVTALKTDLPFSSANMKVVAKDGWITLEGSVEWNYARQDAEKAVRRVRGVKGVSNLISVKPKAQPAAIRREIEDALRRSAEVDANRITVEANGSEVILRGTLRPRVHDAVQLHDAALCLDRDAACIEHSDSTERRLDLLPDFGRGHLRLHFDEVADARDSANVPHGFFGSLTLEVPDHAAFETHPAVLHDELHLLVRGRQIELELGDAIAGDLGVGAHIAARQVHFQIVGNRVNAGNALGVDFRLRPLHVAAHEAGQRDHAAQRVDRDVRRVDVRVPSKLFFDVSSEVSVG